MLLCRVSEGSNTLNKCSKNHRLIVRLAQTCFDRRNISRHLIAVLFEVMARLPPSLLKCQHKEKKTSTKIVPFMELSKPASSTYANDEVN